MERDKKILDVFKTVDKLNPEASFLDESALSVVDDWIDTGSYALNAIISGSLYKGVPVGRIFGLAGPTGICKTLIMNKIMANAQQKGYMPVIWDSELAVDINTAKSVGCDTANMRYYPVETIEDARNQIARFLDNVIEQSLQKKFIIGLDSLGNLASSKEINDAAEGKDASEMGQRAKACLDPNTLILLENGVYKKIKDIQENDNVITHLKRIRPVKKIWVTFSKKIYKFNVCGKIIKMSENHRMLVYRDNKLQYIMAKYIKNTDKFVKIR